MKSSINHAISYFTLSLILMFSTSMASAASNDATLYQRLGGYDAIKAVVDDVVSQLVVDEKLGRFWAHRGDDGIAREVQFIVDFIVAKSGGPLNYGGREMKESHVGMQIDEKDWKILISALQNTLQKFKVPVQESKEVLEFFDSTKEDIVEKS